MTSRPNKEIPKKVRTNSASNTSKTKLEPQHVKLTQSLGLSMTEFERYQELEPITQTKITALLKERKSLNRFVTLHLGEKINAYSSFTALMQFLLPTEHALRYALKKVDDIEHDINLTLNCKQPLFDSNTTKKTRLELLLAVALDHRNKLTDECSKTDAASANNMSVKIKSLNTIITEFKKQLKTSDFRIHNAKIRDISDPDLYYFMGKLKSIGITELKQSTSSNTTASSSRMTFMSAIIKRFYPGQQDTEQSDDNPSP